MEKSKRKVLFLITKSNWGGAQRYVFDLATSLPKGEFEAVVALGGNGVLVNKLEEAGVRVINIPSLERDVSLAKEWRAFEEVSRVLKSEQPSILHINSSKAGALGALIGRIHGVPKIIFTAHGWAFNENRSEFERLVFKAVHYLTVLLSHQTIAVSREVRRQMNWPGAQKKITVIHNGRTIPHFYDREEARTLLCEVEPRLIPYRDGFWSVTIAELHPIKRHDAVIEAFKKVVEQEPNTRHLIIGGGEQEEYLREQIRELGLEEHVFLLGSITEAAEYLKAVDLFVLASRSEAMAYVIIEAAAAGLPIVATSVGGIPEAVTHGDNAFLTPPLDNKALFEAILLLRRDQTLQEGLGQKAHERSSELSLEITLEKTLSLYST